MCYVILIRKCADFQLNVIQILKNAPLFANQQIKYFQLKKSENYCMAQMLPLEKISNLLWRYFTNFDLFLSKLTVQNCNLFIYPSKVMGFILQLNTLLNTIGLVFRKYRLGMKRCIGELE